MNTHWDSFSKEFQKSLELSDLNFLTAKIERRNWNSTKAIENLGEIRNITRNFPYDARLVVERYLNAEIAFKECSVLLLRK